MKPSETIHLSKKTILFLLLMISGLFMFAQSGISWSSSSSIAANSFNNKRPRIVMDASGNPLVLWGNSNTNNLMFSRWNGSSFTTPVQLNPATMPVFTAYWAGPDIASKGDTVYVTFKQTNEDTSKVYVVHSFNGGVSFSAPVRVEYIADSLSRFPTLATDENGNPIVAFMKFNSTFGDSRWVVSRSADYGSTFTTDVKASGYSGGLAEVCDCCPGAIVASSNKVAMLYRDNLSNIRDIWTGISTDNGASFPTGINVDQHNWMLSSCPASGPDAVIIDDSLYSVYMSGTGGKNLIYSNKSSLSALASSTGAAITGNFSGLLQQNFPRIANYTTAVAKVWKQATTGSSQVALVFTANIHAGFPVGYDTVAIGTAAAVTTTDVAVSNGVVHVVWQDDVTGTVKYRKGTYTPLSAGISNLSADNSISIYPNPAQTELYISGPTNEYAQTQIEVFNLVGEKLISVPYKNKIDISNLPNGIYFLKIKQGTKLITQKFIKQ